MRLLLSNSEEQTSFCRNGGPAEGKGWGPFTEVGDGLEISKLMQLQGSTYGLQSLLPGTVFTSQINYLERQAVLADIPLRLTNKGGARLAVTP